MTDGIFKRDSLKIEEFCNEWQNNYKEKLFHCPFTEEPISIREIGSKLNIPVGIMHGADDKLVKPQSWVKPSFLETKPNFDYIASQRRGRGALSGEQNRFCHPHSGRFHRSITLL